MKYYKTKERNGEGKFDYAVTSDSNFIMANWSYTKKGGKWAAYEGAPRNLFQRQGPNSSNPKELWEEISKKQAREEVKLYKDDAVEEPREVKVKSSTAGKDIGGLLERVDQELSQRLQTMSIEELARLRTLLDE